jgi:hypothetical protein
MTYDNLCLVVEGKNDEDFFLSRIWPRCSGNFKSKKPTILRDSDLYVYASRGIKLRDPTDIIPKEKLEQIADFRTSGQIAVAYANASSSGFNGLLTILKDNDRRSTTEGRKAEIIKVYGFLSDRDIEIVVQEIESWIVAGISKSSTLFRYFELADPNSVDKEQFHKLIEPLGFDEEDCGGKDGITGSFLREYIVPMGSCEFDLSHGMNRSESLKHFVERLSKT